MDLLILFVLDSCAYSKDLFEISSTCHCGHDHYCGRELDRVFYTKRETLIDFLNSIL